MEDRGAGNQHRQCLATVFACRFRVGGYKTAGSSSHQVNDPRTDCPFYRYVHQVLGQRFDDVGPTI